MASVFKKTPQVARAVQHPNQFNSISGRTIEQEIVPYRKAAHTRCEFFAITSGQWILSKHLQCLIKSINQPNGCVRIVTSDEYADFINVLLALIRTNDGWHEHPSIAA